MKPLYPLLKSLFPYSITTSQAMGKAMIALMLKGYGKKVLGPSDINLLAKQ